MFTCPEKDIHSIYLDGELPDVFVKEYEAHLAACEKCRMELQKLRSLHSIFAADSASLNVDEKFLEDSFCRLQGRMRFQKIVSAAQPQRKIIRISYFIPAAVAAAAVFAIMMPLKLNVVRNSHAATENIPVISKAQDLEPIANSDLFVEGGIQDVALHNRPQQDNKPLGLKASNFEVLKQNDSDSGMTIRLADLKNLNSISASDVSLGRIEILDIER